MIYYGEKKIKIKISVAIMMRMIAFVMNLHVRLTDSVVNANLGISFFLVFVYPSVYWIKARIVSFRMISDLRFFYVHITQPLENHSYE